MTRFFVGNIAYSLSEQEFADALNDLGARVESVRIVMDRENRIPRGFGFIDVLDENAEDVRRILDGALVAGRPLRISDANKQPSVRPGPPPERRNEKNYREGVRSREPEVQQRRRRGGRFGGVWED